METLRGNRATKYNNLLRLRAQKEMILVYKTFVHTPIERRGRL